ncbi:hypothetical protein [Mycolicibacterium sp.]|uniref:hypothetical protein n=1 Tax=Mycolicibacterium sp. TaxID=2320850 RepID=UPI00355D6504
MTAALPTRDPADLGIPPTPAPLRVVPPLPPSPRSDGLIPVRLSPLIATGDNLDAASETCEATETFVDQQLIVDYTGALARRTAAHIRDGVVEAIPHHHQHPAGVACLRCAVLGAAGHKTLATTLLEVMNSTNADEAWNNDPKVCTDVKMISRLRRLAISSATLEGLYGPHWAAVMLTCLRVEHADFELLAYLTRRYQPSRVLMVHTRDSLAAYHLALVCCPWITRDGRTVSAVARNAVGVRLAVAIATVAVGEAPEWLDHLPAPAL